MSQIHAYLEKECKLAFEAYARHVGVEAGTLLRLLIARELRRRRLPQLVATARLRKPARRIGGMTERKKVTAHYGEDTSGARFASHAGESGTTKTAAARLLVDIELRERWLEKCLDSEE
ncbi:MAG: hypothetical protein HQL41_14590 [Alphaproteobacteria bacterium]|nr:hypothetical protein [Alphaproteobacteria bacterium]